MADEAAFYGTWKVYSAAVYHISIYQQMHISLSINAMIFFCFADRWMCVFSGYRGTHRHWGVSQHSVSVTVCLQTIGGYRFDI